MIPNVLHIFYRIASGYETACGMAVERLKEIAMPVKWSPENVEPLIKACQTALCSKVVNGITRELAEICVKAVLAVADFERKDVNLDLIKLHTKVGGELSDTCLINGVVIDKEFSHSQMKKEIDDAKVCILTCPFEPPKPKSKHSVNITSVQAYEDLYAEEQQYFRDQIEAVKKSGANTVICQWGFDDEANHLLLQNGLNAIRWVGGVEIEVLCFLYFFFYLSIFFFLFCSSLLDSFY